LIRHAALLASCDAQELHRSRSKHSPNAYYVPFVRRFRRRQQVKDLAWSFGLLCSGFQRVDVRRPQIPKSLIGTPCAAFGLLSAHAFQYAWYRVPPAVLVICQHANSRRNLRDGNDTPVLFFA
jgi:hypothetical protein